MKTTLILIFLLFAPGVIANLIWRLPGRGLLNSLLVSYLLLLANAYGLWHLNLDAYLAHLFFGEVLLLLVMLGYSKRRCRWRGKRASVNLKNIRSYILTFGVSTVYLTLVGPYLEIPADVWRHLSQIGDYNALFERGVIDLNQPWYLIYALALAISEEQLIDTIGSFSYLAPTLFLLLIVDFVRMAYQQTEMSDTKRHFLEILAVVFTLTMFGTSSFSFVRYYVFAPAFFSFPLFLFGVSIVGGYKYRPQSSGYTVLTAALLISCLLVTYLVHKQETAFLLVFIFVYCAYRITLKIWTRVECNHQNSDRTFLGWIRPYLVWAALIWALVFALSAANPNGIDLRIVPALTNNTLLISLFLLDHISLVVADPAGRVFETVNLWSLTAIVLYFWFFRKGDRNLLISVLVIAPWFCVFNPIFAREFVDIAGHDVLWRFAYMTPVGIVGAHVVVFGLDKMRQSGMKVSVMLGLLGLLLFEIPGIDRFQNLRWHSLGRTDIGNSHLLWEDLVVRLGKIPARNILTDPITGYVVRALTDHKVFGFKFHDTSPFIPINYSGYSEESFAGFDTWLFIQNYRDGTPSSNGRYSGHWPEDVMVVSDQYSGALREFLLNPPHHFRLLWEDDGIRLYEIRSS